MAKNAKPVFLIGTNQVYPSIDAAAKVLGVSPSGISKVVSGKIPAIKGYRLGLLSERVIRVPETGQTFANPVQAARRLHVKANKVSKLLKTGATSTTGGYHFVYDIAATNATNNVSNTTKKSRKSNKKQQIKARQQKKRNKLERATKKAAERAIDKQIAAEKRREKEIAKQERIRRNEVIRRTSKLKSLLEKINDQLLEYAGRPGMLEYSSPAHEVMEFMQYLNEDDDLELFDVSQSNMDYIAETMSDFEIAAWIDLITNAVKRNNSLFFDIDRQEKERNTYAQEFGIALAQIEEYAEFIPELWLIFREGARLYDYPHIIWDKIKQAVKGDIPKDEFRKAMDKLKAYFTYSANETLLQQLLADLDAYAPEPEITDDIPF